MLKKVLSIICCIGLVAAMSSCGKSVKTASPNDKVTLKWVLRMAEQQDTKLVETEINKQLETLLPNTKVELSCVSDMAQKWSQWMATKTPIDLAWSGFEFNMKGEVQRKSFLPLDDLVAKYAPSIQTEKDVYVQDYESARYKGALYAIPNQQPKLKESVHLRVPAELYKYMDVDALLAATNASPYATEELYQVIDKYFEAIVKADATDTDTVGAYCDIVALSNIAERGYDFLEEENHGSAACYKAFEDKVNIQSFYETEEFQMFIKYAARWFEKGYISKDVLLGTSSGNRMHTLSAHPSEMWYNLDEARGVRYVYGNGGNVEQYNILLTPQKWAFNGATVFASVASYTVIPVTSKNPERAMQFLDLLRSEKGGDLLNLVVYGFEKNSAAAKQYDNYHYTLDGDLAIGNGYTVQPDSNDFYGFPNWLVGNVYLTYRTPDILKGQSEYAKNYLSTVKPTLHKTSLYKFTLDTDSISGKLAQVNEAVTEFKDVLLCGVKKSDYVSTYQNLLKKLTAAGLDDIKAEMKKQADAYIAAK